MTRVPHYDFFVIGAFRFPHGDASAQRLLTLGQTANLGGRRSLIVNDTAASAPVGYVPGQVGSVDGVDFVCLSGPRGGRLSRLTHRLTRPARMGKLVSRHSVSGGSVTVSVASGLCSFALLLVLRVLMKVHVVADVVERHDASQFVHGRFEPQFLRHRWTSLVAGRLADGVIVISSKLASIYRGSNRAPLLLPPLVDLADYPPADPPGPQLELLYVGNPRGKDLLGILFDAIAALDPNDRNRVRLTVAGADIAALEANPDVGPERVRALGRTLRALGYVDRPRVLQMLAHSDFSILIRPATGYAAAGFPSKIPESLAAGCPVICNITTDLGLYLADGDNALICRPTADSADVTVDSVGASLVRALNLTPAEKAAMKASARTSAQALSTNAWAGSLASWLEGAA